MGHSMQLHLQMWCIVLPAVKDHRTTELPGGVRSLYSVESILTTTDDTRDKARTSPPYPGAQEPSSELTYPYRMWMLPRLESQGG